MRTKWTLAASLAAAVVLVGCQSLPPGAEPGPHHTMAYIVPVNATDPGAHIEVNGQDMGQTPIKIKIFGDPDGTFHDFGSYYYVVRALPIATNQYPQAIFFRTGKMFTPEDRIPSRIDFDMTRPAPQPPPTYYYAPPPYPYPYYYYGPGPYWGGPYWGPSFRFYVGPGFHHW